jgi:hypothetical protein
MPSSYSKRNCSRPKINGMRSLFIVYAYVNQQEKTSNYSTLEWEQHFLNVPIIVRRHELRHALNVRRLQSLSESTGTLVTYYVAKERSRSGISHSQVYALRVGHKNVKGNAILPLLPSTSLMITQNIDRISIIRPFNEKELCEPLSQEPY